MTRKPPVLALFLLLVAACQSPAPSSPAASSSSATTSAEPSSVARVEGRYDIGGGRELTMTCYGSGSPTIILQPGGTDVPGRAAYSPYILESLGEHATACVYDRDDLDLAFDAIPERTIFDHVDDLRALMAAAGVECPCIWEGWSFGGAFALASALDDPEGTAGLVILDTDFPVVDGTQRCIDLGIPADQCAPDPGDALALTWGQQVADRVVPLPGVPVRIMTSDEFPPDCPEGWDCPTINERIVSFQGTDWATLSHDFEQQIVHVQHDVLATQAEHEVVDLILSLVPDSETD